MSHSSVTGVRSKSFIRLWISGKYSLENHFSRRISMSLLSLSCTFRGVPGMSSSFCFHWMRRSAMSMWALRCSSIAYRQRMSLTVMLISAEEIFFFHSSQPSISGNAMVLRPARTDSFSWESCDFPPVGQPQVLWHEPRADDCCYSDSTRAMSLSGCCGNS